MLPALTAIFACQLAGETLTVAFALPLPGPVVGMMILFVFLIVRGHVPENLGQVGDTLLGHLSLLFVPAGAGIMQHVARIEAEAVPLAATLIPSTLATIAVTAFVMNRFATAAAEHGEPSE